MANTASDKWKGVTGGGNFGQKSLIFLFKHCSVRVGYFFMYFAIPFYMLFGKKSRKAIMHYFKKVFGFGKWKSFINTWKTYNTFGKVLMDRFSIFSGQKPKFKIQEEGNEHFWDLVKKDKGFMLAGSHTGNFEICGYLLKQNYKKNYALVFGGEGQNLQKQRFKQFSENNVEMLAVQDDMSHLFAMNQALEEGNIITMSADRNLGSTKNVKCKFGNAEANFPLGPFSIAVIRDVPVLAVFVFREKTYKYKLIVKELTLNDLEKESPTKKKAEILAKKFVKELECQIKKYPNQWFNFFEFFD